MVIKSAGPSLSALYSGGCFSLVIFVAASPAAAGAAAPAVDAPAES